MRGCTVLNRVSTTRCHLHRLCLTPPHPFPSEWISPYLSNLGHPFFTLSVDQSVLDLSRVLEAQNTPSIPQWTNQGMSFKLSFTLREVYIMPWKPIGVTLGTHIGTCQIRGRVTSRDGSILKRQAIITYRALRNGINLWLSTLPESRHVRSVCTYQPNNIIHRLL